jgi:hypothetical protein
MRRRISGLFIFYNLFIPSLLLTLYFLFYSLTTDLLNIEGVNTFFSDRAWIILLPITTLLALACIYLMMHNSENLLQKRTKSKIALLDLVQLLFPLTPIVQYIVVNYGILSVMDMLIILGFFSFLSFLLIFLIPKLLGAFSPTRILSSLGVAFTTTFTSMSFLSKQFNWYYAGSLKIQIPVFVIFFFIAFLIQAVNEKDKKFYYWIIVIFFLANSTIQFINKIGEYSQSNQAVIDQKMQLLIQDNEPKRSPNIYLLIYDSYVCNETMLAYGIDNSEQENYLRRNSFVVYPKTYSTGSATLETMRVVFQLSPEYSGESRSGVSGNGLVHKVLKDLGYKTIGLFEGDYWFKGVDSTYDTSYPQNQREQYQYFISAVLIGEFRFDQEFNSQTQQQFVQIKQSLFEDNQTDQRFIYAHTELPNHSQNSGACLEDETELYVERLSRANKEMKDDIEKLIESDPDSIIIIAGDHGPYLTKNCYYLADSYTTEEINRLDIQDRFGTFLAIRWPDESYKSYDQIVVIQDLFPAIFSYLYDDPALLQMRVEPVTQFQFSTSGAYVEDGIIRGGIDDGEALFFGASEP